MGKIILLSDIYKMREAKEKELAYYEDRLKELQNKMFFLRKEIDLTNFIIDIIENGTAGTTDIIIPNDVKNGNSADMAKAVDILQANKVFLQHEIVSFVNSRFGKGYIYDKSKCSRDTGLIVDSIAFDLLFDGKTQSLFAGLQYWSQGSTKINGEQTQTVSAIDFAKSIMKKIVVNESITNTSGNKLSQIINTSIPGNLTSKKNQNLQLIVLQIIFL